MAELQKHLSNDTVFNKISRKYISLREDEIRKNNYHLQKALNVLINKMVETDKLFQQMFERVVFGGSFYKGTKISTPMEFDLDIVIKLPINYKTVQFQSKRPGYIKIHVGPDPFNKNLAASDLKVLKNFVQDSYLDQDRFRGWVEGIISRTIVKLQKHNDQHILEVDKNERYGIKIRKSGPAFTMMLNIPNKGIICVDFVPVLAFKQPFTDGSTVVRFDKFRNKEWLAIPKPLRDDGDFREKNLHWRLSFYQQEREILARYGRVKPVIRQMKKLRDTQDWKCIASYYIETLFLNEMDELKEKLDQMPMTLLFFMMLKKLHTCCSNLRIEYYWNRNLNLIGHVGFVNLANIKHRLNRILSDIEKNIADDPFRVAKYILNTSELRALRSEPLPETEPQQQETEGTYSCRIF